jgi:chemotaxis protein histidine kinase CheA
MEPVPSSAPVSESAAVLALFFPKEATELLTTHKEATELLTTHKEATPTTSSAADPASTEKRRKPRMAKKKEPEKEAQEESKEPQEPQEPQEEKKEEKPKEEKPKKTRAKRVTKAQKAEPAPSLPTHQDSCIPTHLEQSMEPHRLDDYEVEYVPLTIFIYDNVVYFRDARKNKLYRRVKEKTAGSYVGRYDTVTDVILTDIPDSDDEESSE